MHKHHNNIVNSPNPSEWIRLVTDQVTSLRYGVVQIVVHDSRVVQVERTEKVRLDYATADATGTPTGSPEAIQSNRQPTR